MELQCECCYVMTDDLLPEHNVHTGELINVCTWCANSMLTLREKPWLMAEPPPTPEEFEAALDRLAAVRAEMNRRLDSGEAEIFQ